MNRSHSPFPTHSPKIDQQCRNTPTTQLELRTLVLQYRSFLLPLALKISTVRAKVSLERSAMSRSYSNSFSHHVRKFLLIPRSIEVTKISSWFVPANEYIVKDHKVPVDGGEILVRSVAPTPKEGEEGTYPLLVWYHGGGIYPSHEPLYSWLADSCLSGWVMGDVTMSDYYLRNIAVNQRVAVLNVEYR